MSGPDSVVMYRKKGSSKELFTEAMTSAGAELAAGKLDRAGFEVIAPLTAEHAAERKVMLNPDGGLIEGAHLHAFLSDTVRRFRQDYPGVSRESALEVVSLLCTLALEGESDLQAALLDEVHAQTPAGGADWRQDMLISISNRNQEGAA